MSRSPLAISSHASHSSFFAVTMLVERFIHFAPYLAAIASNGTISASAGA